MRNKVTVVGAGNVGATTAQRIFDGGYADVVLVDIVDGLPQGKALDMLESGPILGTDSSIVGTNGYEETEGSDVVVVTSGIARKPGMSRDDLLLTNMKIVTSVVEQTSKFSPNGVHLIVTNPLDAMAQQALKVTGFPSNQVVGMAGILDTARYRTFLAEELGVSVNSVSAYVLGGHGDTMVPITRLATIGGIPAEELIPKDRLDAIVERVRFAGGELVKLFGNGSAYYAPAASAIEMAEAYLKDKKRIIPSAALCEGEFGVDGYFIGVPTVIGAGGIEKILEFKLLPEEQEMLNGTLEAVKKTVAETKL